MTTHDETITTETRTARDGWCNACEIDRDLAGMSRERYAAEADRRQRLHLKIGCTVIRLCPACAKKVRAALFAFSA